MPDTYALGLIKAAAILEDGRIPAFVAEKYSSYNTGIGKKIREGAATLEECAAHATGLTNPETSGSGKQERLEAIFNSILFG